MSSYTVPPGTRIGHIHLKVSDIDKALAFYQGLLGFEITQRYGPQAVFLSAGGYHHHIGLNTWHSKNAPPAPQRACGLYHTGAADHGVSEAIYLNDPDGNGVELYWDKPREQWPFDAYGNLQMVTDPLHLESLLREAE
jgi:catechol 2,3-dioxygenase